MAIDSGEALEAWLQDRPREVAVAIMVRAALRVAPLYWNWVLAESRIPDASELTMCRAMLTSRTAAAAPSGDIKVAAAAAAAAIVADSVAADTIATAAYSTACSAAYVATTQNDSIAYAAAAATAGYSEWPNVDADCAAIDRGGEVFRHPLWRDNALPDWLPTPLPHHAWRDRGPGWAFWADWYEGELTGHPLPLDLLTRIARIAPEDWDKGDDHVNALIAGIRRDWAHSRTPNAEVIELNPATGRLRAVPLTALPADHLADARDKLLDAAAIFDGQGGANGPYGALVPECELLRDAVARHPDRPMRLYDVANRAARRARARASAGDCPTDALVEDFTHQLDEAALDLLNFDPKVKEVVTARAAARIEAATPADRAQLAAVVAAVAPVIEGTLAEELPQDVAIATDPAEPEATRKEATYRIVSRSLGIHAAARALTGLRKAIGAAAGVAKDVTILSAAYEYVAHAQPFLDLLDFLSRLIR